MRPSRDEVLMAHARIAALRGTCSRLQVGAVASRDGRILVTGYNGTPAGMPHCDHSCDCGTYDSGQGHTPSCRSIPPCVDSVHDVQNCVAYAARLGVSLLGAEVHTTDSPCPICARLIINAGIVRLVYDREYRIVDGLSLLKVAGVQIEKFAGRNLVWYDAEH